jgi:hypothetical protein
LLVDWSGRHGNHLNVQAEDRPAPTARRRTDLVRDLWSQRKSDEPKGNDDGILGRAKRLAGQVGEYARSDEAREKLDAVKKRAVEVGGMVTAGARKLADSTRQAAAQARASTDKFSKSEDVRMDQAEPKGDWDEIRGEKSRAPRMSESPIVVALAILFFFPAGLFLLWKHPVLSRNKTWWWVGGIWSFLNSCMAMNGDKETKPATAKAVPTTAARVAQVAERPERPAPAKTAESADSTEATEEVEIDEPPVARSTPSARTPKPKKVKIKKGINLENYERIMDGMSREEVEAMLGKGREFASSGDEKEIVYTSTNIITGSRKTISILYHDGRVAGKGKVGF